MAVRRYVYLLAVSFYGAYQPVTELFRFFEARANQLTAENVTDFEKATNTLGSKFCVFSQNVTLFLSHSARFLFYYKPLKIEYLFRLFPIFGTSSIVDKL